MSELFVPHAIRIDEAGGVDDWIDQIVNADMQEGIQVMELSGSSETDREFVAIRSNEPVLNIVTTDLSFLSVCGLDGIDITPDGSNAGLYAYGRQVPNKARREAVGSTVHIRMNVTDGLLVPVSVQGSHNQPANFTMALHAILGSAVQSGATPMVFEKDQAIATGASQLANVYVPAAVKFTSGGSTLVTQISDINVAFGIDVQKRGFNSEVDPTHVSINGRSPTLAFTTTNLEHFVDVGRDGKDCSSFAVYFQKMTANGSRVAKGTSSHISIVSTSGLLTRGAVGLKHNSPGTGAFTFRPVLDTNLFTISTSATIPTS